MLPMVARTIFRIQERLLGRETFALLRELEDSQWWPGEQLDALRAQRLAQLAESAHKHTPYWREVMDRHGIRPEEVRSLQDLRRFPLLDKATLRSRRQDMVRRDLRRVQLVRTSGSTNEALQFHTSSIREAHINAARIRGHRWIGVDKGDREVYFWGAPVELHAQDRLKRLRDRLVNDMLTSALVISPQTVPEYVETWARWRVKCLFGFPSCMVLLARMAARLGVDVSVLKARGLKVVCTTAEILGANRRIIAEAFGVPVYDSFGLREGGLVAHECAHGTMHATDEQLILETIDPRTLRPSDGEGELVITNLVGLATPLIRYRTGDAVTLSNALCPCGRSLSSLTVSGGRMLDFVVTSEGRWVGGVAFIYTMRAIKGIIKFQVRQERIGQVRVLLAVDKEFSPDGVQQVKSVVGKRLGCDDEVLVELVDDIQPAPSGKYRPVISRVAEQLQQGDIFPARA
jgi:phenylacetate-CoA ligase